jgi:hypothetical protein
LAGTRRYLSGGQAASHTTDGLAPSPPRRALARGFRPGGPSGVAASQRSPASPEPRGRRGQVASPEKGAFERLERLTGKRVRAVLRGRGGGNITWLPDHSNLTRAAA